MREVCGSSLLGLEELEELEMVEVEVGMAVFRVCHKGPPCMWRLR
jgi:hypothetical protein